MSASVYNPRMPPGGPLLAGSVRLSESLDSIRAEFDVVGQDLAVLRAQRDEFEAKVNGQVNEANIIRQSLYELETQHQKIRAAYESEINQLRQEVEAMRADTGVHGHPAPPVPPAQGPPSAQRGPPLSLGGPGGPGMPPHPMDARGPPPALERMDSRSGLERDRDRERERERDRGMDARGAPQPPPGLGGPPPPGILPGPGAPPSYADPFYNRRDDRDRDRDRDLRERDMRERELRDRDMRERERDRDRERGRERPGERDRERDRELRERDLRERERDRDDRDLRERDPKRLKTDRMGARADHFPPSSSHGGPPPKSNPTPSPHPHSHHPPAGYEAHSPIQPQHSGGPGAPSVSGNSASGGGTGNGDAIAGGSGNGGAVVLSGSTPFPDDMDVANAPPELKKEGSDWFALFNPKVKRALDVTLVHTLEHESVVCCVRFSADGKYLATGCNRTAQIFDTKTGALTCSLHDDGASKTGDLYIRSVCFSPDGRLLATGAEDKTIRLWDIAKKRIVSVYDGHTQEIYSLDFSRDGRLIASGSGDRTARIWDVETRACKVLAIDEPDQVDSGVTSVAISPTGALLAAGSLDTVVRIWDVQTGALVERLRGHTDSVYSVKFTPDGKGLVSGSLDKTLKYWDVRPLLAGGRAREPLGPPDRRPIVQDGGEKGCKCTMNFTGHKDFVLSVAVSHDGQWVVSGSKDRGVQFWDSRTAQAQLVLQGHKNSVISIDLSPSGSVLATGSGDNQARLWTYSTQ